MTQKDISKLLQSDKYKYKTISLGNNKTQIIIEPTHINCAMCNETIKEEQGVTRQDRRVISLIVERKYCKSCAINIDDILINIRASHKAPIGVMV